MDEKTPGRKTAPISVREVTQILAQAVRNHLGPDALASEDDSILTMFAPATGQYFSVAVTETGEPS